MCVLLILTYNIFQYAEKICYESENNIFSFSAYPYTQEGKEARTQVSIKLCILTDFGHRHLYR